MAEMQVPAKSGPEKKFRAGAIAATVWKNAHHNEAGEYSFHTINLDRRYKDKDGNWKSTASMRAADLPKAVLVLNKAYEYLMLNNEESASLDE